MKKLTEKEILAIVTLFKSYGLGVQMGTPSAEGLANEVCNAIDCAEGYPVGSGDKYLDAKVKIEKSIKNLNSALFEAGDIGLHTDVQTALGVPTSMPVQDRVNNTQYRLNKIYKEF